MEEFLRKNAALMDRDNDEETERMIEEEASHIEQEMEHLLLDGTSVDVDVLMQMPLDLQQDIIGQMHRSQRIQNRDNLLPVAGDMNGFSRTQLDAFLHSSKINNKIRTVQYQLGASEAAEKKKMANSDFDPAVMNRKNRPAKRRKPLPSASSKKQSRDAQVKKRQALQIAFRERVVGLKPSFLNKKPPSKNKIWHASSRLAGPSSQSEASSSAVSSAREQRRANYTISTTSTQSAHTASTSSSERGQTIDGGDGVTAAGERSTIYAGLDNGNNESDRDSDTDSDSVDSDGSTSTSSDDASDSQPVWELGATATPDLGSENTGDTHPQMASHITPEASQSACDTRGVGAENEGIIASSERLTDGRLENDSQSETGGFIDDDEGGFMSDDGGGFIADDDGGGGFINSDSDANDDDAGGGFVTHDLGGDSGGDGSGNESPTRTAASSSPHDVTAVNDEAVTGLDHERRHSTSDSSNERVADSRKITSSSSHHSLSRSSSVDEHVPPPQRSVDAASLVAAAPSPATPKSPTRDLVDLSANESSKGNALKPASTSLVHSRSHPAPVGPVDPFAASGASSTQSLNVSNVMRMTSAIAPWAVDHVQNILKDHTQHETDADDKVETASAPTTIDLTAPARGDTDSDRATNSGFVECCTIDSR